MKLITDNLEYQKDITYVSNLKLNWNKLKNANILIAGATGMVGHFLVDVLINKSKTLSCNVFALGRNENRLKSTFSVYLKNKHFFAIKSDVNFPINIKSNRIDYVIHAASNTHPVAYAKEPITTIASNVIGTKNLLDLAVAKRAKRFLFISSNEIYGENRNDVKSFDETYCGYIDSNTLRAGYPESKRCGESLCQAYKEEKKLDVVVARLTRTYGPTILNTDTKVMSQFIKNALNQQDIVLKSKGAQEFSYIHVVDAVSGLLTILLKGSSGEAYNIADSKSDITLKKLANNIAEYAGVKVSFQPPSKTESKGFSVVNKALLDGNKLHKLGWKAKYNIKSGVANTLKILKDIR